MVGFGTRFFIMCLIALSTGGLLKYYDMGNLMKYFYIVSAIVIVFMFRSYLKLDAFLIKVCTLMVGAMAFGYLLSQMV